MEGTMTINTTNTHIPKPLPKRKEHFFGRWIKRAWNFIPSVKAVTKGVKYVFKKFVTQTKKGINPNEIKQLVKSIFKTLTAFASYPIKSVQKTANHCPLDEKPMIIKIESNASQNRHFHGGAYYDGIAVDSNGRGNNGTPDGKMEAPVDTKATYFILYPSKLGLDTKKLKQAFQIESQKQGDYDFYINNCINHVIRPLQQAGAKIDFGEIATPKELCIWCDSVCLNGAGFCLNETEYQKLLTQLEAKEHNKQIIEKLYAFSKLKAEMKQVKPYAMAQIEIPQAKTHIHKQGIKIRPYQRKEHALCA